jgi:transposase
MSQVPMTPLCRYRRIVGFDVGKTEHSYNEFGSNRVYTVANTQEALRELVGSFDQTCLLICEATGGYEALLLEEADRCGVPAHRADAVKVKAFIRSLGRLGKTDSLDSKGLSHYGNERWASLALWRAHDPTQAALERLVARREELVAMRTAERNRASAPLGKANTVVAKSIKAMIAALQAQIVAIDAAIAKLTRSSPILSEKVKCMCHLKGVGAVIATSLCALMPELGTMNRKKAAALAGLAPHPRDSGARHGYRKIRGGRRAVRSLLFMGAMAGAKYPGPLKDFYDGLLARGKKKLVALAAVMRKMIVILNARLRELLTPPTTEAPIPCKAPIP